MKKSALITAILFLLLSLCSYAQDSFVELPELYLKVKLDDNNLIITQNGSNYSNDELLHRNIDLESSIEKMKHRNCYLEYVDAERGGTIFISRLIFGRSIWECSKKYTAGYKLFKRYF